MSARPEYQVSRRSAVALAATLLATLATAAVTAGGLRHWAAPAPSTPAVQQVQAPQQAPAAAGELD